jgi:adenosylcobinamide-phosphate synthase
VNTKFLDTRLARPAAIVVGFALDRTLGEPPVRVHPIVGFGSLMNRAERLLYRDSQYAGIAMCATGVGIGAATGVIASRLLGNTSATALSVAVCVAGKMLTDEASHVAEALQRGDLDAAKTRVIALVGRSPEDLTEPEITRAVIESLAENTVDAVIASVVWAAIGGAPAVLAHRAINTLDAMVGHHSPRYENFGWASAKLDDVVNWLPARIAALAVALVYPSKARQVRRIIRRDAPQHPSPNGGVIEAAFAGALGLTLGGTNRYGARVEERGRLGDGRTPEVNDVARAIRLSRQIGMLCALIIPVTVSGLAAMKRT